jgi:hypothetical protein
MPKNVPSKKYTPSPFLCPERKRKKKRESRHPKNAKANIDVTPRKDTLVQRKEEVNKEEECLTGSG